MSDKPIIMSENPFPDMEPLNIELKKLITASFNSLYYFHIYRLFGPIKGPKSGEVYDPMGIPSREKHQRIITLINPSNFILNTQWIDGLTEPYNYMAEVVKLRESDTKHVEVNITKALFSVAILTGVMSTLACSATIPINRFGEQHWEVCDRIAKTGDSIVSWWNEGLNGEALKVIGDTLERPERGLRGSEGIDPLSRN